MPIIHFHLIQTPDNAERNGELLRKASALYAEILESPIERVRAYIVGYPPDQVAIAGELANDGTVAEAPYFTALALAGRPVQQRQRLLAGFTDLIVDITGAPRDRVRGQIIEIEPENWAIGGVPASVRRADEIATRNATEPT